MVTDRGKFFPDDDFYFDIMVSERVMKPSLTLFKVGWGTQQFFVGSATPEIGTFLELHPLDF